MAGKCEAVRTNAFAAVTSPGVTGGADETLTLGVIKQEQQGLKGNSAKFYHGGLSVWLEAGVGPGCR